jgi:DnaK suppressor protein
MDSGIARRHLLARREELAQISEGSAQHRRPVELDQQAVGRVSRIDAIQMQEMSKATEARRQTELKRIDAALSRIAEGDFGFCVICDEEIEPKRLDFDPALPTCRGCAEGKRA